MALISEKFVEAIKSVRERDEFEGLNESELTVLEGTFETKLAAVRAKLAAKKPKKDEYDFDDEVEKPKSSVTKVSGTYGKVHTDQDEEGQARVAAKAADAPKRGRGRPRKNS